MWPNKGMDEEGNFPPGLNNFPSFAGSSGGVPFQQLQGSMPPAGLSMHLMAGNWNGFNADGTFNNPEALVQNGSAVSQFSAPERQSTPSTPVPTTLMNLNTRAAELKAKLLRNRQGPPATAPRIEGSSAVAPDTPTGSNSDPVDDLIQQYSGAPPETNYAQAQKIIGPASIKSNEQPTHLKTTTLESPRRVGKPEGHNGTQNGKILDKKRPSRESLGDVSEGEIVEETSAPTKEVTLTEPKESKKPQLALETNEKGTIVRRETREEDRTKKSPRDIREEAQPVARPITSSRPSAPTPRPRNREDRRAEDSRDSRRPSLDHGGRRPSLSDDRRESQFPLRRGSRDRIEDERKDEAKKETKRDDIRPIQVQNRQPEVRKPDMRENKPPTLEELLPYDADLREWLLITGWHIEEYKSSILEPRRRLAAIDAEREKVLAEIAAHGRTGYQPKPSSALSMPPPPAPSQPAESTPKVPESTTPTDLSNTDRNKVNPNKRPLSPREEHEGSKRILRIDDRHTDDRPQYPYNIKEEDIDDQRNMRYDSYRGTDDRRGFIDEREYNGRGRGSRARSFSPPRDSRDIRDRGYHDRGATPPKKDARPFEMIGGYRGRAYDPNFRGRGGRGRGRGDSHNYRGGFRPSYDDDDRDETVYGSRVANMKPTKDRGGFSKGGQGETRYFIVKSFNEDNVIACIESGIWTTQKHVGEILKEAFETCKNVILVFSINRSKAFQGYARMESLPGSVNPPEWQRHINWEIAGAFLVRWLVVCSTRFQRIGHLKNALNENQAVLIGKDGQEIEENCGVGLLELIDEEYKHAEQEWFIRNNNEVDYGH
ncbi:YT521-B-like domain-containing protein [Calycina marina]|uniref:YT521-B-like domain-containing protein n=1 Tax=Calycina marina TaxID=1763456 RepID=A0A9P8CE37_9HELO|nr:YT521-B-like domain-containing protein [Calycina marina]